MFCYPSRFVVYTTVVTTVDSLSACFRQICAYDADSDLLQHSKSLKIEDAGC